MYSGYFPVISWMAAFAIIDELEKEGYTFVTVEEILME